MRVRQKVFGASNSCRPENGHDLVLRVLSSDREWIVSQLFASARLEVRASSHVCLCVPMALVTASHSSLPVSGVDASCPARRTLNILSGTPSV